MVGMVTCVFCKGEIAANAMKCRYCGEWVSAEGRAWQRAATSGSRFAVVGNGTVIDRETNLMWADHDTRSQMDWDAAKQYATALEIGGYANWRLPTASELRDFARTSPQHPHGNIPPVVSLSGDDQWASDTRTTESRRGLEAMVVHFSLASAGWYHISGMRCSVLPVRSLT